MRSGSPSTTSGRTGGTTCRIPFLLAADLGSRTTRIRLGTAVVVLPLWHPLRAAENIAMLDQMLKGRLEIGFGRASQPHEVVTFNPAADPRRPADSRAVFAEGLEVVKKALTEEFFSHSGAHYELPPRGVSWSTREGFEDDPRWTPRRRGVPAACGAEAVSEAAPAFLDGGVDGGVGGGGGGAGPQAGGVAPGCAQAARVDGQVSGSAPAARRPVPRAGPGLGGAASGLRGADDGGSPPDLRAAVPQHDALPGGGPVAGGPVLPRTGRGGDEGDRTQLGLPVEPVPVRGLPAGRGGADPGARGS